MPGGLIVGKVTDANTQAGVDGATVTSTDAPADDTTTVATPDDPKVGDGFYWTFSHATGNHTVSAAATHYTTATATADIAPDSTTSVNLSLKAGQLKVTPASIAKTVAWGKSAAQTVTVTNTGTAPATLKLGERSGGVVVQQAGAPLDLVQGSYSPLPLAGKAAASGGAAAKSAAKPADSVQSASGDAWQPIADLPVTLGDNAVETYQGTVYSAFGYDGRGTLNDMYAYSTNSGAWTKLASARDLREAPVHGLIDGKIYVTGGWGVGVQPDPKTEIYDIATDTWSTGANSPKPYGGVGSAVVNGKLYSVGGCTASGCGFTDVTVYDPQTDTWASVAPYPEPVSWSSCGGIGGKLYCSGGTRTAGSTTHAYVYDPATDSWSAIADQPTDAWGAAYTVANGMLLVEGGATQSGRVLSNQVWAYQPSDNTWTALPNANASLYRGGGSVGFYAVGGMAGAGTPTKVAEVLPGYDQPETTDVTWLSESTGTVTVQPGASATVTVTVDASAPEVTQPGVYSALLTLGTDTPYRLAPSSVSMTIKPPATWGKIAGAVTAPGGAPIVAATVQINTSAAHYTLKTGKDGTYELWLNVHSNPLQVVAAKDGFQPAVATVRISKGATTTQNFTLLKD
ncbi:Kelch repeat-containing protein [Streptomyces sp. CA-106110]|uniref:Kelch repeat-containing protein n=1 Tax=Streptomyces sp. CA-106110 TaxID=3240044 RepID=UPI003D94FE52